ncbi:thiamine biosynthesis protein ThiS [Rheinheimera sp. A13L]|uniref:sulfur carrier protein ThiS n=1 Tax=Rheinheimera sp. A13L TaxID=506534 RepID=UPI0002124E1D|nr:sulfur carrier protein ThiS [Rheinheimera sp. A13L]EGM75956.1 thiamine biosynthesis protein ThiS [Rheinheimera sp. A13L]
MAEVTDTTLNIWLNGKAETLTSGELIDLLPRFKSPFAVALNGHFIAAVQYPGTQLKAGDQLDIVSPIAGG